jgi:CHAT domain-containing protein
VDLEAALAAHGGTLEALVKQSREAAGARGRGEQPPGAGEGSDDGDDDGGDGGQGDAGGGAFAAAAAADDLARGAGDGADTAPSADAAGSSTAQLQALHALLFPPAVAAAILAAPRLLLVPHGPLFLVPFAALPDANGTPLVERHAELRQVPSLQVLAALAARRKAQRGAAGGGGGGRKCGAKPLVVGVTENFAAGLQRLHYTAPEAMAVAKRLGTTARCRTAQTKANVLARLTAGVTHLHLATHGLLEEQALAFEQAASGEARDASLLRAREIYGMDLRRCGVAVLSACNTAGGSKDINSDGVAGLQRAFMAAGVHTLVISLWHVDDASTKQLMESFYAAWCDDASGGLSVSAALRVAMAKMRAAGLGPRHWGAFVVAGLDPPAAAAGALALAAGEQPAGQAVVEAVLCANCEEGEEAPATVWCADHGGAFCAECDAALHRRGKAKTHERSPVHRETPAAPVPAGEGRS